jgi:hypothetical protein
MIILILFVILFLLFSIYIGYYTYKKRKNSSNAKMHEDKYHGNKEKLLFPINNSPIDNSEKVPVFARSNLI